MRLRILLIALISSAVAQQNAQQRSARTPQAQIRYQDPNGLKVDWKLFSHRSLQQNQQQLQQEQQAATHYAQQIHPQQQVQSQPAQSQLVQVDPEQLQYKSYLQPQAQEAQQQINQVQYKTYEPPGQVEAQQPNQIQYKTYEPPQASTETHGYQATNQAQYQVYQRGQVPEEPQPDHNQVQYNAYSNAAAHQQPSVLYSSNTPAHQQYDQHSANAGLPQYVQSQESYNPTEQQKSRREYPDNSYQGKIVYKEEYEQQQQQQQVHEQYQQHGQYQQQGQYQQPAQYQQEQYQHEPYQHEQYQQPQQYQQHAEHVSVPVERLPIPPPQKLVFHKNMPKEIQQLLQFQAQLPYNVIANSITYKPKTFVPKPLPAGARGPYSYRSKTYYVNNGRYETDFETTKPVAEDQRH